jgi:pectin methylesterase-like acyl-CoA thioesterase
MKKLVSLLLLCISVYGNAQLFKYIVATDGTGNFTSIQAAIDACADNERSIIFVKNGTYSEQVTLGTKSTASAKKISLIGESYGGVLITHSQSRASSGSPTYEDVCTVKFYASDLYAENISIQNAAGNTGMAEALYTAGDRQTFKNCKILGYQDTYRSKKGTRGYFKNCWIEGAVDFIYAGGTIFFDDCTINCVKGGGYIVAPEDSYATIAKASTASGKFIRLGFIFRNCKITANSDVSASSYTLGRPWNTYAGAYYLNCTLGNHISSAGWSVMGGNESSASFAEYNSVDTTGAAIDVSGRISWSFQLAQSDAENILIPSKVYYTSYTATYDPITLCISPSAPSDVTLNNKTLTWFENDTTAIGYIIYKDGKYLGSTDGMSYTDTTSTTGNYTVKAVNSIGVLSADNGIQTSVAEIQFNSVISKITNQFVLLNQNAEISLYTTSGILIRYSKSTNELKFDNTPKGIYIVHIKTESGFTVSKKINIQ